MNPNVVQSMRLKIPRSAQLLMMLNMKLSMRMNAQQNMRQFVILSLHMVVVEVEVSLHMEVVGDFLSITSE